MDWKGDGRKLKLIPFAWDNVGRVPGHIVLNIAARMGMKTDTLYKG